MAEKYFKYPFASGGDKVTVPNVTQPDGSVSYEEGWTFDYERDYPTDPDAKVIPRDAWNEIMYQVTNVIKNYQEVAFPTFITTADNGGTPFPYSKYATVRWDNGTEVAVYESLVSANTSLPSDTTKWRQVIHQPQVPTGTIWEYEGASLPDGGWIWPDGKTIGNASSGATNRANADTEALFTLTWNSYPNSIRPIQNSDGSPGTRGISAAADFAANKRLPVRDRRGNVAAGRDNMGGTAANRLTTAGSGIDGTVLGASGGSQNVTLGILQIPAHHHALWGRNISGSRDLNYRVGWNGVIGGFQELGDGYFDKGNYDPGTQNYLQDTGGGEAHNNVQPTTVNNFILKL